MHLPVYCVCANAYANAHVELRGQLGWPSWVLLHPGFMDLGCQGWPQVA